MENSIKDKIRYGGNPIDVYKLFDKMVAYWASRGIYPKEVKTR